MNETVNYVNCCPKCLRDMNETNSKFSSYNRNTMLDVLKCSGCENVSLWKFENSKFILLRDTL